MIQLEPQTHRLAFERLEAAIEALSAAGGFDSAEIASGLADMVDRRVQVEELRRSIEKPRHRSTRRL